MDKEQIYKSGILELYVLGLTSTEEKRIVEESMEKWPDLREEVESLQAAMTEYARQYTNPPAENVSPPPQPSTIPSMPAATPMTNSWVNRAGLITTILFFFISAYLYNQHNKSTAAYHKLNKEYNNLVISCQETKQEKEGVERLQALLMHEQTIPVQLKGTDLAPDAKVIVYWNALAKKALLNSSAMPPPPSNHQYQLWAEVSGEMVSLGMLDSSSDILQAVSFIENAESLNITIEEIGGSHVPSVQRLIVSGKV